MSNLRSVLGALHYLDGNPTVSSDPRDVVGADALILPGVGSFYKGMEKLDEYGLSDALREAVLGQKCKILGICLGQQLMAEWSDEDGGRAGLGFFSGSVSRFGRDTRLKVPHIGFNEVRFHPQSRLFAGFGEAADFYFVHSFRLDVEERPGCAAVCDHGGDFVAAYEQENIYSVQFHPEKSQTNGLQLLSNFLAE